MAYDANLLKMLMDLLQLAYKIICLLELTTNLEVGLLSRSSGFQLKWLGPSTLLDPICSALAKSLTYP